jgi:hypothetical protein
METNRGGRWGRQAKDFPKLREILSIAGGSGNWTIRFQEPFWHHMENMVAWSDNKSASYCVRALGYCFIAGTMMTEGLYEEGRGGLWLSTDYGSRRAAVIMQPAPPRSRGCSL